MRPLALGFIAFAVASMGGPPAGAEAEHQWVHPQARYTLVVPPEDWITAPNEGEHIGIFLSRTQTASRASGCIASEHITDGPSAPQEEVNASIFARDQSRPPVSGDIENPQISDYRVDVVDGVAVMSYRAFNTETQYLYRSFVLGTEPLTFNAVICSLPMSAAEIDIAKANQLLQSLRFPPQGPLS